MGAVERANQTVQGQVRTLADTIYQHYAYKVLATSPILPWIIRHAGWLTTRFLKHSDGRTSYWNQFGKDYSGDLAVLGECVLAVWNTAP